MPRQRSVGWLSYVKSVELHILPPEPCNAWHLLVGPRH